MRKQLGLKFKELSQDYNIIVGIKQDIPEGSIANTMQNLQRYELLKDRYLNVINNLHLDAMKVLSRVEYQRFQKAIKRIKETL